MLSLTLTFVTSTMAKGQVLSLLVAQCAVLAAAAVIAPSGAATPVIHVNAEAPAEYNPNPSIGGGGSASVDSAHFRVVGASTSAKAKTSLQHLEAAHACFVETLGWRTPGLSFNTGGIGKEVGPWYKLNVYSKQPADLGGAAGSQGTDMSAGLAFLNIIDSQCDVPAVVVHEYGHAMHLSEKNWINQGNTGAWWETVAVFIADTYIATPTCNAARAAAGLSGVEGDSIIALQKVIGDSHQVIVDGTKGSNNNYEAWPFIAYLTNNPDAYAGLGDDTLLRMIREYKLNSNETPLHALERLLSETPDAPPCSKSSAATGHAWPLSTLATPKPTPPLSRSATPSRMPTSMAPTARTRSSPRAPRATWAPTSSHLCRQGPVSMSPSRPPIRATRLRLSCRARRASRTRILWPARAR